VDGVRQEVNSLLIELDASAERNINILEDRIQQLKVQIADADRRITLLGQENRKHQNEAIIYNRSGRMQTVPGDNASIIAGQNTQGAAATAAPAYTYGSQAAVQAVQSQSLAAQEPYLPVSPAANIPAANMPAANMPAANMPAANIPSSVSASPDRRQLMQDTVPFLQLSNKPGNSEADFVGKVLGLHVQGLSPTVIASRLGATTAEVDIVIAMDQLRSGGGS